MPQKNSGSLVLGFAGLVGATSLLLAACGAEDPLEPLARSQSAATVGGSCQEPALDFEDVSRWQRVSGTAPAADPQGKSGLGIVLPAGTHVFEAVLSPLTSSWSPDMTLALRGDTPGQSVSGRITAVVMAPNTPAVSFNKTFGGVTPGVWSTFSLTIPNGARQAALAAHESPVTVRLQVETTRPLHLDELRFGDLVCARCNPALPGVTTPGDGELPLPGNTTPTQISFRLPQGVGMRSIALGANGELKVNDRAVVRGTTTGSHGAVTNTGSAQTNIGVAATVGNVHSVPNVFLRGGTIAGDLIRQGTLTIQPPGQITGTNTQSTIVAAEMSWTAHLPTAGSQGTTLDFNSGTHSLPFHVTSVGVHGGTLRVTPGAHVVSSLSVQPVGTVLVDNSAGDVFVYVRSQLDIKGPIVLTNPNRNNVAFVYLGQNDIFFTRTFTGTIIAPNSKVVIDRTGEHFFGSVFAKNIEVHQDSTFHHLPYDTACDADAIHVCGTKKPGCALLSGCEAQMCLAATSLDPVNEPSCYETAKAPLWGFADLHAHPATELGWGTRGDQPGMFVGSSGFDVNGPFPSLSCNPDLHMSPFPGDPILGKIRETLLAAIDSDGRFGHTPHGTEGVGSWPSARSVVHQQMRVDWLRRAFDGGLRLMFAAVANNRLLDQLWHTGFNINGNPVLPPASPSNTEWDVAEAERQLVHIEALAAQSSSWMEIVDSAASARAAIQAGKLAVVLSLEMDTLDIDAIRALKSRHKISHVIPIHLADNGWGGTALYSELFEGNSWFLNGGTPIQIAHDPVLSFHLPHRTTLEQDEAGAVKPTQHPLSPAEACNAQRDGHKNALGLTPAGIDGMKALMELGMFIDVSHMGDRSTDDTIALLTQKKFRYPVMSSHTGIRADFFLDDTEKSARGHEHSERSLSKMQAKRIGESGGVMGVGTAGGVAERVLADVSGGPVARLGGPVPSWQWLLSDRRLLPESTLVQRLELSVQTGLSNKRSCNELTVRVTLRTGEVFPFVLLEGQGINPNTWVRGLVMQLPRSVPLSDISSLTFDFNAVEKCVFTDSDAEFHVADLKVTWEGQGQGVLLQRTSARPLSPFPPPHYFVKLDAANPRHVERLRWSHEDRMLSEKLLELRVRLRTGSDDLEPSTDKKFVVSTTDRCFSPEIALPGTGLAEQTDWAGSFDFTPFRQASGSPFTVGDVLGITLDTGGACALIQCVGWDNWNVDFLTFEAVTPSGTYEIATHRGLPFARPSGHRNKVMVYEAAERCDALSPSDPAKTVLVNLKTGDDRASGADPLRVRICEHGGFCAETLANPSAPWNGEYLTSGGTVAVAVKMRSTTTVGDLRSLEIEATDPWELDRVQVTIPDDPLEKWNGYYQLAASTMQGRGVALGTDLNGLQHQLAFSNTGSGYPFTVLGQNGTPAKTLEQHSIGSRTLDFEKDGLAHYGMLADMVAAVRNLPGGQDTYNRLFRSAEDVVRMWERIEARKHVLDLRKNQTCGAFNTGPHLVRLISGVSCLTLSSELPAGWGTAPAELVLTEDSNGTLQGSGTLDIVVSNCLGDTRTLTFGDLNEWQATPPISATCPLELRVEGEPGDTYGIAFR